jgi:hypothetical protein
MRLAVFDDDPASATMSRMPSIARATVILVLLGAAVATLTGCASAPIAPTYTQEELKAQCERQGSGWWHPDALTGGFCEPIHS